MREGVPGGSVKGPPAGGRVGRWILQLIKGFVSVFAFDLNNMCLSDTLLLSSWWMWRMETGPPPP